MHSVLPLTPPERRFSQIAWKSTALAVSTAVLTSYPNADALCKLSTQTSVPLMWPYEESRRNLSISSIFIKSFNKYISKCSCESKRIVFSSSILPFCTRQVLGGCPGSCWCLCQPRRGGGMC